MTTTTFSFQLGDPVEHRGVVIAPLFPLRDPRARYITLDSALARGLTITETSEAGDVPELTVANPLAEDVLLYDGAELVGAKQNRILNVTVLVAAGSTLRIPVSCTEQGRWRSVSKSFSPAPHIVNAELRRRKAAALAAERITPERLGPIARALRAFEAAVGRGESAIPEDFAFHRTVAAASGNPRFVELLEFLGRHVIPRQSVRVALSSQDEQRRYLVRIQKEHARIHAAIRDRQSAEARKAMRTHLTRSLTRYRRLAERQLQGG